jgi:hypothetical protein
MDLMCAFANGDSNTDFIPPAVRAVLLHFWLAYDHPFADGNGRTARALFYWSMARQGYWLCEYVSISRILKEARAQYARSYLYSETGENDSTYHTRPRAPTCWPLPRRGWSGNRSSAGRSLSRRSLISREYSKSAQPAAADGRRHVGV